MCPGPHSQDKGWEPQNCDKSTIVLAVGIDQDKAD